MEQLKKHQVHMVPISYSDKLPEPHILWLNTDGKLFYKKYGHGFPYGTNRGEAISGNKSQHLYFTSDEEIKEGDWVLANGKPEKVLEVRRYENINYRTNTAWFTHCRKIVATTNKQLNAYRQEDSAKGWVALIDEEFILKYIEMYNAGTPITEVMLEMEEVQNPEFKRNVGVSSKNPTYFNKVKLKSNGSVIVKPVKERMHTRAEMRIAILIAIDEGVTIKQLDEWFNKNYPQ